MNSDQPAQPCPAPTGDALRRTEERCRLALDIAALGTWHHDCITDMVQLDTRAQALWGFDRAEVTAGEMVARIVPEDLDRVVQNFAAARESPGDAVHTSEFRIKLPDGNVRCLALRARLFFDGDGPNRRVIYTIGTYLDITERRRADSALRQSESRFRAIIELASDAFFLHEWSGRVLDVNRQACESLGYSRDELIGMTPQEFDPDLSQTLRERIEAGLNAGELIAFDSRHRRKDGTIFPVEVRVRPITLEGRHYALALVRDLTERKALEEKLRQAQKMEALGRLAGGIAHDFNNLLLVITAYCDVLLHHPPDADERRQHVAAINDAANQAARLTSQLLAFSRRAIVEPKVLDLNVVLDSVGGMLRRLIGENIEFVTRLSAAPAWVRIDPGQIEQVIVNLAANARDAMPDGGRLTLKTRHVHIASAAGARDELPPGRYVSLIASDTGTGMTEEVRARVFEPFFTTRGAARGTGLGLATVFGIVNQAAGRITVESRVGAGSTFSILLPAAAAPPATQPPSAPDRAAPARSPLPRRSETVLLVEDAHEVRKLARMALEQHGCTVLAAASGADALWALKTWRGPIHLLVADVVLPDLSGRELADAVRAQRPGIRILYMSGYTDDVLLRRGVSEAADAFLQKPFSMQQLIRKVREVLDAPVAV